MKQLKIGFVFGRKKGEGWEEKGRVGKRRRGLGREGRVEKKRGGLGT